MRIARKVVIVLKNMPIIEHQEKKYKTYFTMSHPNECLQKK